MELVFKAIDDALRGKDFLIDSLRKDRDELTNENKTLRERIKELETEIEKRRVDDVMEGIK